MSYQGRFSDLWSEQGIDRRQCQRVVPMKVLVIGLHRTGTSTMKAALEGLEYGPCYHMADCFQNPLDCDMWMEAFKAKFQGKGRKYTKDDWDQLLGHCQSIADVPPAAFIPELYAAYPDAKVVIVQRDPDSWYNSSRGTVMEYALSKQNRILSFFERWRTRRMVSMISLCFICLFGIFDLDHPTEMREAWLDGYSRVYDEARRVVPEKQRLEYKLGQGWEPLCRFLATEVPEKPFPHINAKADFGVRMDALTQKMWMRAAIKNLPYLVGALAVTGAILWYR